MAVEAHHLNLFDLQLIGNRNIINPIESNPAIYNGEIDLGIPLSEITSENLLPFQSNSFPATIMKADSGVTHNFPVSRKRYRDSFDGSQKYQRVGSFSFFGEDISSQIYQQQFEIDRLITQHTEKVRLEVAERRKRFSRRLIGVLEEGVLKRLKANEEEMEKIKKLNWVLEERVKTLYLENQIWRELAQTNEATVNTLRSNLEQVLAYRDRTREEESMADDAESCCGSSDFGEEEERRRTLAGNGGERKMVKDKDGDKDNNSMRGSCRKCGKEESCVLLLPCRHLCLCTQCGSTLHVCPVCKSTKNANVHVNLSS